MINVLVWNENIHEKNQPEVREIYPEGIHGCIAEFLADNRLVDTMIVEDIIKLL